VDAPAAGSVLVAAAHPTDHDFVHTVILLVHSGDEGVMGFMLNKPSGFPLSHLFPDLKSTAAGQDAVYLGGYVAQGLRGLVRSASPPPGARPVCPGVWLLLDPGQVKFTARSAARPDRFRAYAGYAGWTRGQLRREVLRGDWRVIPGSAALAFDPHSGTLWDRLAASRRAVSR